MNRKQNYQDWFISSVNTDACRENPCCLFYICWCQLEFDQLLSFSSPLWRHSDGFGQQECLIIGYSASQEYMPVLAGWHDELNACETLSFTRISLQIKAITGYFSFHLLNPGFLKVLKAGLLIWCGWWLPMMLFLDSMCDLFSGAHMEKTLW